MTTAALYVRVSTEKQEADNQLIALRKFCEKREIMIVNEFVDIISGTAHSRPQYDIMFREAHKCAFDIIIFWDLSRFSRAGTLQTLNRLNELDRIGIRWLSFQEQYLDSAGQFKDVVISIMATLAKIEREKISERTKAGLVRAKAAGHPCGKRGPDRKKRKRSGYFRRWAK